MSSSLKQRTGFAIFWSFVDKGGQQLIQLIFSVVLARILLTSEIGTFALLAIFIAVANILQESGFSAALIRKKEPQKEDFSSVFYFNVGVSFIIYFILFFTAPLISWFYENPVLTDLSRVVFLSFLFNAFGIIQNVVLIRNMDFKTNTKITLISGTLAGVVAVVAALNGYGIWSLVLQLVMQTLLRNVFLWIFIKWRPKAGFSFKHLKSMIPYSSKLLATSVMNQICGNLYANIIGKFFNTHQAGVYSQANKLSIIPQSVISDGIRSAAFPALAKTEGDVAYTKRAYRKVVRILAFVSFPIAALIVVVAKPVILLVFTEKWADSIPILQILALGAAFYPLYSSVSTLLQVTGKTDLIFKMEGTRNILALSLIFITIKFGVIGLVLGISFVGAVAFFGGMIFGGRTIEYKVLEIIKDTMPFLLIAFISIFPFWFLESLGVENLFALLLIPILGIFAYLGILKLLGSVILDDSIAFFREQLSKLTK